MYLDYGDGDRDKRGCKIQNLLQTNENGKREGKLWQQAGFYFWISYYGICQENYYYIRVQLSKRKENPFYKRITIKHKTQLQLSIDWTSLWKLLFLRTTESLSFKATCVWIIHIFIRAAVTRSSFIWCTIILSIYSGALEIDYLSIGEKKIVVPLPLVAAKSTH